MSAGGPVAGAGEPRRVKQEIPKARRFGSWLVWWVLLMGLWALLDDSIQTAELLAGAAVAAMGALLAELAQYQAATHFRMRIEWTVPAFSLPLHVAKDTVLVFRALWDQLARGRPPASGFRAIPVRYGSDTPEELTRRALIVGANSLAPNTFALGLDEERDVMYVHQLVVNKGEPV